MALNKNYEQIYDHLKAGIWMQDTLSGKLTYASKGFENLLQIPLDTLYEDPNYWQKMVLPKYKKPILENQKKVQAGQTVEDQYQIVDGKGKVKWVYEQTIPSVNEQGELINVFGMITNITARMEMQEKLAFLATHDALTQLPNYHSLDYKMDELIKDDKINTMALLHIEIDDFNRVVDYLGYRIGEKVLKKLAHRLNAMRPTNSYLAKVASYSFVLLLTNYQSVNDVYESAGNILRKMGEEIKIDGFEFHITASIGASFYPEHTDEKLILIETARVALYYAKHLGKNNYQIYSLDRDISAHKKYVLEKDLRRAITNKEFELYYQPQVNPKTGAIESAEALIRWNHKEWGVVSPGEFIPLAEEKHLIDEVGDWVIRTVCEQLQTWKKAGYTLFPISINVSPTRFLRPGIVETVRNELNMHEISPHYIELEITENALLKNEKNVLSTLRGLKNLGVRIALDDFGTGYSSFHYLQKFKIDTLKIDQTFIQSLGESVNEKSNAIVRSFLQLAKALEMKVIAEGVETQIQLDFLKQQNCDLIQGYLFSRPVQINKLEKMLKMRYLKPTLPKRITKPTDERRRYFRFTFPHRIDAKMDLIKLKNQKVNIGSARILIENISLGGIRFLSSLRMPVTTHIQLKFHFKLMGDSFNIIGSLVYKNEEKSELYSYGVKFDIDEQEKDKLAAVIKKMTLLEKTNQNIPKMDFIKISPYVFFQNSYKE